MKKKYIISGLLGVSLFTVALCATFIHPNKMGGLASEEAESPYTLTFKEGQNQFEEGFNNDGAPAYTDQLNNPIKFLYSNIGNDTGCWHTMTQSGKLANIEESPIHGMKKISFEFAKIEGQTPKIRVAWNFEFDTVLANMKPTHYVDLEGNSISTEFENLNPNYVWIVNSTSGDVDAMLRIKSITITYDCVDHPAPATA